jgi:phosphoribosyl 1,2-cyclic phosphodiesterase
MYSPYRFAGLTMICIEVNYSLATLAPDIDPARKARLLKSHMSLETALKLLAANDLSKVCEIWLLHLSRSNSDAELFKREVEKQTGKPTYIAEV